jgi:hypothetical protein
MNTDQATLVLASLRRAPRGFRSFDISNAARQRLDSVQHLLETYGKKTKASAHDEALAKLNEAYRLLGAEPPSGDAASLPSRKHPFLVAFDNPNPGAETDAWKALFIQLPQA